MDDTIKNCGRVAPLPEPTPEMLRRWQMRDEVRRARDRFHAATSALNLIENRLGDAIGKSATADEREQAWNQYEADLVHLIYTAKGLDVSPWPDRHPGWMKK